MLRKLFFWPLSTQDNPHYPSGRPDLICPRPGHGEGIVVECKMMIHKAKTPWRNCTFPFSRIEPRQRLWLNNYTADGGKAFLALATPHGRAGTYQNPRLAWLVPWKDWLSTEAKLRAIKHLSLALIDRQGLHNRVKLQERELFAYTTLAPWGLTWQAKKGWTVRPSHPLWVWPQRDLAKFSAKWKEDRN